MSCYPQGTSAGPAGCRINMHSDLLQGVWCYQKSAGEGRKEAHPAFLNVFVIRTMNVPFMMVAAPANYLAVDSDRIRGPI